MPHPTTPPKKAAAKARAGISPQAAEMIAAVARIEERTNHVVTRLDGFDERLNRVVTAIEGVARIEERQAGVRALLDEHMADEETDLKRTRQLLDAGDARLTKIEQKLPALIETRKWIVSGVIGILAMVGMTAWDTLFHPNRSPTAVQAVKSAIQAAQPDRTAE